MAQALHAHKMVADLALGMAMEVFEDFAKDNEIYKQLRKNGEISEKKARAMFAHRVAQNFFEEARKVLTSMLGMDTVSKHMKDEIAEALILDNEVRALRPVSKDVAVVPSYLH